MGDELLLLMDVATQLLEASAHCLAASPWPFTLVEIIENLIELHEDPASWRWSRALAKGGVGTGMAAVLEAPSTVNLEAFSKEHGALATTAASGTDGAVRRTL